MNKDIVYYNIFSKCSKPLTNKQEYTFIYKENRAQGILTNPADYLMTIERIDLSVSSLPVFIPLIQSGNVTNYACIMGCNGSTSSLHYANYICRNKYASNPSLKQYYYMYNCQDVLDLLNSCFNDAYTELNDTSFKCPVLKFNGNIIQLYCDENFINNSGKLYINDDFYFLLKSFSFQYNVANSMYGFIFDTPLLPDTTTINGTDYYIYSQEDSYLSHWSPVSAIVVSSNNFKRELQGNSFDVVNTGYGSTYINEQPYILDIILSVDNPNQWNGRIIYIPSGNERDTMITDNQLKDINISIQWRDRDNNMNDIAMVNGNYFAIKFKFSKFK